VKLIAVGEALDRANTPGTDVARARLTRAHGFAVDDHRTRAAVSLAAAVLRAGQAEVVAKHVQERFVRWRIDAAF
jgi:hypothetical protein